MNSRSLLNFLVVVGVIFRSDISVAIEWSDIENIINRPQVRTIDDFLSQLPESLRRNFNLVHHPESRSQSGSFAEPRTILSSEDGHILLTFTGETAKTGSDRVESIRFDRASGRFLTSEIVFPADSPGVNRNLAEKPYVVNNPQRCMGCHFRKHNGERGRSGMSLAEGEIIPLIDPYFRWPGWYGSENDYYFDHYAGGDITQLQSLSSSIKSMPRYRHLMFQEESLHDYFRKNRPNTRLNQRLNHINAKRIVRQLKEHPQFNSYRYALLAALIDAENIPTFVPVSQQYSTMPNSMYLMQVVRDAKHTSSRIHARQREVGGYFTDVPDHFAKMEDFNIVDQRRMSKFLYVFEGVMGQGAKNLSLTLEPSYILHDGSNGLDVLMDELGREIGKTDPIIKAFFPDKHSNERFGGLSGLYMLLARYHSGLATELERKAVSSWRGLADHLRAESQKAIGGIYTPNLLGPCVRLLRDAQAWISSH